MSVEVGMRFGVYYIVMKIIAFLTSRGFAVFLLFFSLAMLVLWNTKPSLHPSLFLLPPATLLLSISFCTLRRVVKRGLRDVSFIGSLVFHVGLLTVIAAAAIAPLTRFGATVVLPRGVSVTLDDERFSYVNSAPPGGQAPFVSLRLDWQESDYEDGWFPVGHAAGLNVGFLDGDRLLHSDKTVRINAPFQVHGYQFMLYNGQRTPLFVLKNSKGGVLFTKFVNVTNRTEEEDVFYAPKEGLTFYTRFFPDLFDEDGSYGTRSAEPRNPAFGLKVVRDDEPFKDIWRGVLKVGEKASFSDFELEFAALDTFVTLQVSKDPTYWGMVSGWVLIVVGLIVRYARYILAPHDMGVRGRVGPGERAEA